MANENTTNSTESLNLVTDTEVVNAEIEKDSKQTNGNGNGKNGNGNGKNGKKTTRSKATRTNSGKTSKTSDDKNTWVRATLNIDPGNKMLKFSCNGSASSPVPSIYKELKGDLPVGKSGCFGYKGKNYIVGNGAHSLKGKLYKSYEGHKTSKIDIWVLAALTSDSFLDEILQDEHYNKYPSKPCRIKLNINLLSLTTEKVAAIKKTLQEIQSFTYRNRTFEIEFTNLEKEFIHTEGLGAALTAFKKCPDLDEIGILDLGGGTIAFSILIGGKYHPKVLEQYPASGGGMVSVATCIFDSINTGDIGGQHRRLDSIFAALKTAKAVDKVPYRLGNKTHNIAEAVSDGLDKWVDDNPTVLDVLTKAGQYLLGGGQIFATGGGLASPAIANWIKEYLSNEIDDPQFEVLDNPHVINLTGMQILDDQE